MSHFLYVRTSGLNSPDMEGRDAILAAESPEATLDAEKSRGGGI